MPRVAKFGRGREKKTYPINSPLKKRAKAAGSGELDCSSEESVVGLLNAININMHPGDKIIPPCVTPNKIDDGPEGNVGGAIKETVINDSIFSQTALYKTSKPLIELWVEYPSQVMWGICENLCWMSWISPEKHRIS